MKKSLFLTILIFLSAPSWCLSAVNMRNGAYTESWIDHIEPGDGYDLRIERFYSSRSLFDGLFGFGWCTSFETFLDISSDGVINLTECGGGLEVSYYPEQFEKHSLDQTINLIIKNKMKSQKLSKSDIKSLQTLLRSNTRLRFQYANELHLIDTRKIKSPQNTFHANTRGLESISYNGNYYERQKSDGVVERFGNNGRLIQITNAVGAWVKLQYQGTRLLYLVDNKGRRLNFSYSPNGKLSKISNGKGLSAEYKFSGSDLVEVTNIWKKTYKFQYDEAHNLTLALFPDNSRIQMTYDLAQDWVKTYTNRLNCRETYSYTMSPQDPKNNYWSQVEKVCNSEKVASGRHEFWYQAFKQSKDKYLHRVKEESTGDNRDIYFHPYIGRPISCRENEIYQGFAYYLNGLLNKREYKKYSTAANVSDWTKSTFNYLNQTFRLYSAEIIGLNPQGKPLSKTKSIYSYNKKGVLEKVTNSSGEFVSIVYDEAGRIQTLKDHRKIEIQLSYGSSGNRPVKLSQNGSGDVQISYDSNGEIADIEDKSQRNIASSLIENFLRMVDLIGPAGESVKF